MIHCSSGREIAATEIYATLAKSTTNEGAVEDAGKIGEEAHRKRKYMCHGSVRKQNRSIHAPVSYTRYRTWTTVGLLPSPCLCFLWACNITSRERIERRRGVKSDEVYGNEVLLTEIDTIKRSKNIHAKETGAHELACA